MRSPRVLAATAAIVIALAMALFVWPTRYRYTQMKRGSSIFPVRMDRVSGRTEYFDGEWTSDVVAGTPPTSAKVPDEAEFEAWKSAQAAKQRAQTPAP
jgi:hypothetical protein